MNGRQFPKFTFGPVIPEGDAISGPNEHAYSHFYVWWALKHLLQEYNKIHQDTFFLKQHKAAFLLRLFRKKNAWNKHSELHLFQFKWNRNHSIPE